MNQVAVRQRADERRIDVHGNEEENQHVPLTPRQRASLRFLQINTPMSLLCCIATGLISTLIVPSMHYVFRSQPTYFTMAPRMFLAYSIVMLFFEFGFCLLSLITPNPHTQRCIVQGAGSRLALSNYILSMWLLCRIIDTNMTMILGSIVLVGILLLTATNGLVLRTKYRPRWVHPFELLLVHVPNKLVLLLVGQVLLWDQLMLTWGWDRSMGRHALGEGLWFAALVQSLIGIALVVWISLTSDVSVYLVSVFLDIAVLKFHKMPVIGPNSRPFVLSIILCVSMGLRTIALILPMMLDNGFLVICHTHRRHLPEERYDEAVVAPASLPPAEQNERTRLLASRDMAYGTT